MKPIPSTPLLILVLEQLLVVLAASQNFDFFILAQTWPPSFYRAQRGNWPMTPVNPASDFCIHGLWPNKADGSYPEDCNPNSSFTQSKVKNVISEMKTHWPKLDCSFNKDEDFWSHQWKKHGTCSESILNQQDYFETAIKLKQDMNNDLLSILKRAGIEPKDGKSYEISSIEQAIEKETGHTPILNCNAAGNGKKQLYEIWRCVTNSKTPQFFNCLDYPATNLLQKRKNVCGGGNARIYFPSSEEMTREGEL